MSLDKIELTTGLFHITKFYCFYGKIFLLIEQFFSSWKLCVVSKYKSSSKCAINSEMCQKSIFIHLFFSNSIVSLMMFCIRLLSELMILLSTHHVTNHLTCCNKLTNCNVILKSKIWKIFLFFISSFWILKCQDLVLKVIC